MANEVGELFSAYFVNTSLTLIPPSGGLYRLQILQAKLLEACKCY